MLSPKAEQLIATYLNLPFKGILGVRCPYLNNARLHQRGQLRVLVGKGSPQEIVEEAQIVSIHYHHGIFDKNGDCCLHDDHDGHDTTAETIRTFLINNNLGVECSGFVTHVLRAHYLETKKIDSTKLMHIVSPHHILRWFIACFRPIENINVKTYTNDTNTTVIASDKNSFDSTKLQPGDLITMLETGPGNKRNHIVLIREIAKNKLHYVHARAWTSEGKYGHGVTVGTITITKPKGSLLDQTWEEKGVTGDKNETWLEAKNARSLEIRRLKI